MIPAQFFFVVILIRRQINTYLVLAADSRPIGLLADASSLVAPPLLSATYGFFVQPVC